ncbi:SUN domain-containing protein 3-like [Scomber scombrus]|uniref:SUN domain-containing protein 3-like n=1 Tax=Scomber scombrus TaxID=13677 RepID=A0AAV1PCV0_SCOSC
MQVQLTKFQEYMVRNDIKMMQIQGELFYLRDKALPVADTMPNFALESQGANILHHLTSQTYHNEPPLVTFWGIPLWYPSANPRTVIQAQSSPLTPGRCWAFAGRQGHVFISLSHPVTITHGIKTVNGKATRLGTFVYDPNGESLQTFKLPGHTMGVFRFVKLQIESNWGHPEYTCVYNFRVHGTIPMMRVTP